MTYLSTSFTVVNCFRQAAVRFLEKIVGLFCSRAIEKGRAFVSALLAGINMNLLTYQGHSWKYRELPTPELVQVGPKVGSSGFLTVSVSHMLHLSGMLCEHSGVAA